MKKETNKNIFKTVKTVSFFTILLSLIILISPTPVFAVGKTLSDLITDTIIPYLMTGIYLIIALAVVTFVWNVYRYFFTEKEKKEAGMYVLYSTLGFFVILSFWGLVAILSNSLNLPDGSVGWPFGGSSSNYQTGQRNQTGQRDLTPPLTNNDNAFERPLTTPLNTGNNSGANPSHGLPPSTNGLPTAPDYNRMITPTF
mgnify:CR=1 FL=1